MSAASLTQEPVTGSKRGRKTRAPKQTNPWKRSNNNSTKRAENWWSQLFISPFFVMFIIFGFLPIAYSVYLAFFRWEPLDSTQNFVGLDNFRNLWQDPIFWQSTRNTFSIWFFSTIPQMAMALGLASILRNPRLRFRLFWQTVFLVPNITSVVAVAVVFGQLFGRDYGLINYVLHIFGFANIDWQERTLASHIAIATMITWRWVGYNSLIFLASMNAIPNDLYESASLDGANRWQQFRYVTLPQLRNTITFMLIVGTIGGLQVFAEPATFGGNLSGGSAGQFSTLTLYLFRNVQEYTAYGYAAAIGIGITVIVLIISAINFGLTRRIASEDAKK